MRSDAGHVRCGKNRFVFYRTYHQRNICGRLLLHFRICLLYTSILVTGAAGFIGSNLVLELLRTQSAVHIIGIDNMNDYYDVSIKEYRLERIESLAKEHASSSWKFVKGSIADKVLIDQVLSLIHIYKIRDEIESHTVAKEWINLVEKL